MGMGLHLGLAVLRPPGRDLPHPFGVSRARGDAPPRRRSRRRSQARLCGWAGRGRAPSLAAWRLRPPARRRRHGHRRDRGVAARGRPPEDRAARFTVFALDLEVFAGTFGGFAVERAGRYCLAWTAILRISFSSTVTPIPGPVGTRIVPSGCTV